MPQLSLLAHAPAEDEAPPSALARLRARIGTPLVSPGRLPADVPALDAWLHGWPRPGITEIAGAAGAGRLALVIPALARIARQGGHVVIVDAEQHAHIPGWAGLDPSRVVLVRPPRERAAWAAEQVARSGAVEAVVLLDLPPLGRAGLRLARAAEAGGMSIFVVAREPEADVPAALRLHALGWAGPSAVRVDCTKSRDGRHVGERTLDLRGHVGERTLDLHAPAPEPIEPPVATLLPPPSPPPSLRRAPQLRLVD